VMNRPDNTLIFTGEGKPGAFANIDISDNAPQAATPQAAPRQGTEKRGKRVFGF